MNALEVKGLGKVYKGKRGRQVVALQDLDLSVETGEVFGFLGPNGAGKSTTIKAVMGQIRPTNGMAYIFGVPVTLPSSRVKVGYLPENPAFYDFMTASEYLRFVGKTFAMDDESIAVEAARVLELMELRDAANRPIRGYSKGMVQRLGLAQTLLHDPDLYVLDEPMSGLDPLGRALVKEIISDLKKRGKTVFFSTHITSDVEVVCDRVGVIVGGRLQMVDVVESILKRGIEGYRVQIMRSQKPTSVCDDFNVISTSQDMKVVYVPRERFDEFLRKVMETGEEVDLVEPKRRDLEAFFLDIVASSAK